MKYFSPAMKRMSVKWLVLLVVVTVASSCSDKAEEETRKAAQAIEDKTKEIAGDAAEKTKDVASDVADKGKQILSATGEVITDSWITAKVRAKLADEKTLKDTSITVETNERVVTLKGTVGASAAKRRAVAIANGTEGVVRVVDGIVVKAK
jgi:osmotically-inducible protein OsmY